MAGEIQVNSVTALTESGSNIVLNNVDTATNRTNLGLGSIATQAADNVSISGGNITGGTIGGSVVFPAGHVIQVTDEQNLGEVYTTSTSTVAWSTTYPAVTPLVSGSKIIAIFNAGLFIDIDSDSQGLNNSRCYAERKVGDTNFASGQTSLFSHNGLNYIIIPGRGGNSTVTYFHSIYTTTSTSTIYFRLGVLKQEGSNNIFLNDDYSKNTVYFVEVAQ